MINYITDEIICQNNNLRWHTTVIPKFIGLKYICKWQNKSKLTYPMSLYNFPSHRLYPGNTSKFANFCKILLLKKKWFSHLDCPDNETNPTFSTFISIWRQSIKKMKTVSRQHDKFGQFLQSPYEKKLFPHLDFSENWTGATFSQQ